VRVVVAEGGVSWFAVYQDGDPHALALFRYQHDAAEWAEWHAGDVRRMNTDRPGISEDGDGLDPYRVK